MAKLVLDYNAAHNFVEKNKDNNFFWDGYTIVKWSPSNNGYMQKNGMFRKGNWGYASYYHFNSKGVWELNDKYVKFI